MIDVAKHWDGYTVVRMAQDFMPPCGLFVDVGAGIQPCLSMKAGRHVIVEPWEQYHDIGVKYAGHPVEILSGPWKDMREHVIALKPEIIMAMDVIEHMERADGEAFRRDLEEIPSVGAAVFTPHGFKEQSYKPGEADAWGLGGMYWQTHRSGWMPEDFAGWHVIKARGEKHPNEWEHTLLAILDKTGFMDSPRVRELIGEPS